MPLTVDPCPRCRGETWDEDLFCGHCGTDLRHAPPGVRPAPMGPSAAAPGQPAAPAPGGPAPYRPRQQGWVAVSGAAVIGGVIASSVGEQPEFALLALAVGAVLWFILILVRPNHSWLVFVHVLLVGVMLAAQAFDDHDDEFLAGLVAVGVTAVLFTAFSAIRNSFGKGREF